MLLQGLCQLFDLIAPNMNLINQLICCLLEWLSLFNTDEMYINYFFLGYKKTLCLFYENILILCDCAWKSSLREEQILSINFTSD